MVVEVGVVAEAMFGLMGSLVWIGMGGMSAGVGFVDRTGDAVWEARGHGRG